jgi:type 1 fimbria pilin
MNKILLTALAAASALAIATPAAAQTSVSGVVDITGSVADKCIVTDDGTPTSGSFGGSVNLGQLDDTDGTLKDSSVLAASFSAAGAANLTYRIVCTTPNTKLTVNANELTTGAVVTTGYANTVHYNANVQLSLVGGNQTLSNDTLLVPAGAEQTFTARLATGANNVSVTADTFRTPGATDVMLAGTYNGNIQITVAPAN